MIPKDLASQLRQIEIYTRKAVWDYRVGIFRSLYKGRGIEFDRHRRYRYGDDYRQIDWNVTARMNHPYVKKDFEEKQMTVIIMADLSRSMDFSTSIQSKKDLLVQIVAVLAFSAGYNNMSVGLLAFTERIELDIKPQKGRAQAWSIIESIWGAKPRGLKTNFSLPLKQLATRLKRASLLFCISDFIAPEDIFATRIFKEVVHRHDFIPLIIWDTWDEKLSGGRGFLRFRDAETGEEMLFNLSTKNIRRYETLMKQRKIRLRRSLYRMNLDHLFLKTGDSFLDPILGFFLARKRQR